MQESSPKPLRSLWLASAGLAPALALFVLGASTPRLLAVYPQSDNWNTQTDANWTHYTFPTTNPYGVTVYSFPTNPASANNYAYRIYVPPVVSDSNTPPTLIPRGGAIWVAPDAIYGGTDLTAGFNVGVDLIAWNPTWDNSALGVGWFVNSSSFLATSAYFSGWGPGLATIGITKLDLTQNPPYQILGQVADGTTVLKTNHQYRVTASSYDGATFLVQIFDRSQTNTAWQSAISQDYQLFGQTGYCAMIVANTGSPPPYGNNTTQGADATFDNYYAWRPTANEEPSQSPAVVSDTYPPPAGQPAEFYPTVSASVLNLETDYRPGTIQLYMDGTLVTSGSTINNSVTKPDPTSGTDTWPGVTITYSNGVLYPSGSSHTNTVVFETDQEISSNPGHYYRYTNTWWWQAAVYQPRYATNGSLSLRGFDARMVRSSAANIAASDVNLVSNGSFSANVAQFVAWPGYCGGTHGGNGPNPMDIPGWVNGDGPITSKGLNGAGTGGDNTGSPFAPATSTGAFLFMQGSPNSVSQSLAGLAPHTTYQLNYDVAARSGNTSIWQVVVASDYSGAPASMLYDSGAVAGNPSAFQHVVGYFTTPSPLTGTENIQLKHVDGTDDHTIDFANISIAPTNYATLPNSLASAQAVLNYQYAVDLAATNWDQVVAFGLAGTEYGAVSNFPGLCLMPAGGATPQGNSFALEAFAYLQLPAGTNNFSVYSDDAVGIYSGASLEDDSIVLLETTGSSTSPLAFTWFVAQAGLYPLHIIYEQGGGPAYLVLNSVTASTTNLVNAAGSSVQALYPLTCLSSTSIKGPFTIDAVANAGNVLTTSSSLCESGTGPINNLTVTGGTITMPLPTAPKYFRLDGPRATKITNVAKSGANLVITYKTY